MKDIWILGATGRSGRAVAAELVARKQSLVLVGRDASRLEEVAKAVGGNARIVVAASVDATRAELTRSAPAVVLNTIGPFTTTGLSVARACSRGSDYVDISNELFSFTELLGLQDEAIAAGSCRVAGAGFGVVATECLVLKLCEGRPGADRVRVAALPIVASSETTKLGDALASSMLDGFEFGGRKYENGKLVRASIGGDDERLLAPDGRTIGTAGIPTGDLEAAHRASGAPNVVAASSMIPASRVLLPMVGSILRNAAIRNFAKRRLANVQLKPTKPTTDSSWTHARVTWKDGSVREGWLRAGDAMTFTVKSMADVTTRLARGEGKPGAYTPGALFGALLAEAAGGTFVIADAKA